MSTENQSFNQCARLAVTGSAGVQDWLCLVVPCKVGCVDSAAVQGWLCLVVLVNKVGCDW